MRYALINDTSGTNNPGCQATVSALQSAYQRCGARCVSRVPVGAGYDHFVPFVECLNELRQGTSHSIQPSCWRRLQNKLATLWSSDRTAAELQRRFDDCLDSLSRTTADILADCDVAIVNGEGTLHHDRTAAYTLLGWAAMAKQIGLPVAVVNCTIDSFDPVFFNLLNRFVDWLAVREPCSHEYVRPFYPGVRLGADAIFAMPCPASADDPGQIGKPHTSRVGYTPGVLSFEGIVNEQTIRSHLSSLRQQFDQVEFLAIESEDQAFESIAAELGCRVHALGTLNAGNTEAVLSSLSCLVSGRYHICIFGLRAGIPVVPLHSNTWKMRGLMRFAERAEGYTGMREPLHHDISLDNLASVVAPGRHNTPVLCPSEFNFKKLSSRAESNVAHTLFNATMRAA